MVMAYLAALLATDLVHQSSCSSLLRGIWGRIQRTEHAGEMDVMTALISCCSRISAEGCRTSVCSSLAESLNKKAVVCQSILSSQDATVLILKLQMH